MPVQYNSASQLQWYIAKTGSNDVIASFDTFIGMRYSKDASLPMKAVEEGSFFAANKWEKPYEIQVEIAKQEREKGDLQDFISALDSIQLGIDLVDVVTPYKAFIKANVERITYGWSNDENGVALVIPTLTLIEIREIGEKSGGNITMEGASNPANSDTASNGRSATANANNQAVQSAVAREVA
jgi:hypothetical protein